MNVIYRDVWTADPAIAAMNVDIDMMYTDMTTALPTSIACAQAWSANCRTVINYESIVHPLWSQPRLAFDSVGNPILDPVTGKCVCRQGSWSCRTASRRMNPTTSMPIVSF